jgi:acetylglutamate kinase
MIVIKYGGHVLDGADSNDQIIRAIAQFHLAGGKVLVVHGGGPAIDAELVAHQITTSTVSGYRVTTPEVMEVVQRTLSGAVLRDITNKFIGQGVNAVGLSTGDGMTLRASRFRPVVDGESIDIGLVGEAQSVDPAFLTLVLENGYLPVLSPVAVQTDGVALNINGDIAAGSIAGALDADEVLFITDVPGIYRNWPDPESLIDQIDLVELEDIAHTFTGGMVPKVHAVITALQSGAKRARIIDGRDVANLVAAFDGVGGTVVTA